MSMHLKTHPRIWSSISQLIIYKPLNAQMKKKKICEKTQILDGNKLSSAYAKRQTNERFMTWIFPRAPKCLKSNFYLVLNKSHLSNITLDRPWTPSKKVWHSPAENASNRRAPSWGAPLSSRASHSSSPPQQQVLSHPSWSFLSLHRHTIYPMSRKLLIARGKKASWWIQHTNKWPPPKVASPQEARMQHAVRAC